MSCAKGMIGSGAADNGFIDFHAVPSLATAASVKVVIDLYKDQDVRGMMKKSCKRHGNFGLCYFTKRKLCSSRIIEVMRQKIASLLPAHLVNDACKFIRPIGLQLSKWIGGEGNTRYFYQTWDRLNTLCWTPGGCIDKQNTLKLILEGEISKEHVRDAFHAACNYCMESLIPNLWEKLQREERESSFYTQDVYQKYDLHLIAYWVCYVKKDFSEFLNSIKCNDDLGIYSDTYSLNSNMFVLSVTQNNALAVKYFWCKLTDEERSDNIFKWLDKAMNVSDITEWIYLDTSGNADIVFFLLSKLKNGEQIEVIKSHYNFILMTLFSSHPYQVFLLPTLELLWDHLDEKEYVRLVSLVVSEVKFQRYTEFVFKDIWKHSPIELRKAYIKHIENSASDLLFKLWKVQDVNFLRMVLRDASAEQKKHMMFSAVRSFKNSIYKRGLNYTDALLQEVVSSESERKDFKKEVVNTYAHSICCLWLLNDNWRAIKDFLSWGHGSPEVIKNFKKIQFHRYCVVISLLCRDKYDSLERFLNWHCTSAEEIILFKKRLAFTRKFGVVRELSRSNWHSFEKFIDWWSEGDEAAVKQFRCRLKEFRTLKFVVFCITVIVKNWDFVAELLRWCYNCAETIQKFKQEVLFPTEQVSQRCTFVDLSDSAKETFGKACDKAAALSDHQTEDGIGASNEDCGEDFLGDMPEKTCWYCEFNEDWDCDHHFAENSS